MTHSTLVASLILIASFLTSARADSFGSGANAFDIDFVTIGAPATRRTRPATLTPRVQWRTFPHRQVRSAGEMRSKGQRARPRW